MSQIDLPRRGDSGLIHAFKILKDIKGIASWNLIPTISYVTGW